MVNNCSNPSCEKLGKLKCVKCTSVYYCSTDCQTQHWPKHKLSCKKSTQTKIITTSNSTTIRSEQMNKFTAVKLEVQSAINSGDFTKAIEQGMESLIIADSIQSPSLPLPERIQMLLHLSTAYSQQKKHKEAEKYSTLAVSCAEANLSADPVNPQSTEVLSVTLSNKAKNLLALNRIEEANECANKALALAERIYAKNDPRLCKSLRSVAAVREHQLDHAEAEKLLLRAYTMLCVANGVDHGETQLTIEELVQMLGRKGDVSSMDKYAGKNYRSLNEKKNLAEKLLLADSAVRWSTIKRKLGQNEEALQLLLQALKIREERYDPNHPIIGFTLSAIGSVLEKLERYSEDLESLLIKASDIFNQAQFTGMGSTFNDEVVRLLIQLKRVKAKRLELQNKSSRKAVTTQTNSMPSTETVRDEDEDIDDIVLVGQKSKSLASSSSELNSIIPFHRIEDVFKKYTAPHPIRSVQEEDMIIEKFDSFPKDDPVNRTKLAFEYIKQAKYDVAEYGLLQSYQILSRTCGENHEMTQDALKNLKIIRRSAVQQIWLKVIKDEFTKVEDLKEEDNPDVDSDLFTFTSDSNVKSTDGSEMVNEAVDSAASPQKKGSEGLDLPGSSGPETTSNPEYSPDELKEMERYKRIMMQYNSQAPKATSCIIS